MSVTRHRRQGAARPHRRGHDGVQAALEEAGGDAEKAVEILRVKGQAKAAKRGERAGGRGHGRAATSTSTAQVGALVEVNCETDFVARNEEFLKFAREIAVHVASAAPALGLRGRRPERRARARAWRCFEQQADESKPPEVQQEDRRGPPAQVARGGRAAEAGARQHGQARGPHDRAAARRDLGQDGRERRDPPVRPLPGRRVGGPDHLACPGRGRRRG